MLEIEDLPEDEPEVVTVSMPVGEHPELMGTSRGARGGPYLVTDEMGSGDGQLGGVVDTNVDERASVSVEESLSLPYASRSTLVWGHMTWGGEGYWGGAMGGKNINNHKIKENEGQSDCG